MSLADRIASAVIEQYDSLKPRGKPQGREWTVLAGIVAQDTRVSSAASHWAQEVGSPAEPTKKHPRRRSLVTHVYHLSCFVRTDCPLPPWPPEPCRS